VKNFTAARINLSGKDYQFTPRWSLTLLTLLFLALFISLGFWQLSRAKEKQLLQHSYDSRLTQPPIALQQLPQNSDLRFYRTIVTGEYDNAHSLLLDNKIHDHQIGYEVITPFIINNEPRILLINRGWIPAGEHRNQLPIIPAVLGEQTLTGQIYIPAGKPFTLGNPLESTPHWPPRLEALEIPIVAKLLNKTAFPFVILLSPEQKEGFVRAWQPVNMPAHKNIGYAVQWFTFALVLLIIFVALNTHKKRKIS